MNIEIVKRSDFKSFFDMKTRWKDMDALGHINNATFLTYLESGRIELVKKWDFKKPPFIQASTKIDYLRQLSHPASLQIGQKISRVGHKSFDILTGIFEEGEEKPVAQAVTTLVGFDYESQKTVSVPEVIRQAVED
jgi:acyl-CoA thioester hydrolase